MDTREAAASLWQAMDGDRAALDRLELSGAGPLYRSRYDIGTAAAATVGVATLAAAEVLRVRSGVAQPARVDRRHAAVAFRSERYLRVDGERQGELGNSVGGYYRTGDARKIHLHTSFPHHQARMLSVLGAEPNRDAVGAAVSGWKAEALEATLTEAGACARVLRSPEEWRAHPQGRAIAELPPLIMASIADAEPRVLKPGPRPLSGVRVLDLTRVIAGPVCGRTLAAHGADVLRVGAEQLPTMRTLVIDTGFGKRFTHLDLRSAEGLERLRALARSADVVVQAFRPGALDALGLGFADIAKLRPGIVYVSLCAWSHAGPWAAQRGFDSLVQTASGIAFADAGGEPGGTPSPLPAQAIDHGTGYTAAAAAMRALVDQTARGGSRHIRVSLAQTGAWLTGLGSTDEQAGGDPGIEDVRDVMSEMPSSWGVLSFVRPPGVIGATPAAWHTPPPQPGSSAAEWLERD